MTPRQVELVQTTWEKCMPIADQAAALFYGKLFELDPELKPLFKTDIKEQGKKLMVMITAAVRGLSDLGKLVPVVEDLGRRHVGYGVKDDHYATVGTALLWTLEQGLGDAFTAEVKEAWATTYGILSSTMQKAAVTA
ncbi:MAG TPA: globin family protein [Candidatus Binatia bacterium]|nr:globin family protein [Candidatus Binatia bacterium]